MSFDKKNKTEFENESKEERLLKKSLEKAIYDAGMLPNVITGICTLIYICITTKIPFGSLKLFLISATILIGILQFLVAPITNKLITQSISDDLDAFYHYETTDKERTRLLKQLMSCPARIGLEVFSVFAIGASSWIVIIRLMGKIDSESIIMMICSIIIGAYTGCVFAISQTQKVCSVHAANVVAAGVFPEEVEKKHYFGITSTAITFIHIFGPILLLNIFLLIETWRSSVSYFDANTLLTRVVASGFVNIIFYTVLSTMLFKRMMRSINKMKEILGSINKTNLATIEPAPTDLSNEFMYNVYLINQITELMKYILNISSKTSMDVVQYSEDLSFATRKTTEASMDQRQGTTELMNTMQESDVLSKSIAEKIKEVSSIAKKTTEDIEDGFEILKQNMQKLNEISNANESTVEGIKSLSDKIAGISDIAGIINSIADQTNIIAFNAELEASRAGDVGENFKLVSNEIRRLTNKVIQSTNEIRERIIEIQNSSINLLVASQDGSKKIAAGNDIIEELRSSFEDLKKSSQNTDIASENIQQIIEQQATSFSQIVVALEQISQSTSTFSETTQEITKSSEYLGTISQQLKSLQSDKADSNN